MSASAGNSEEQPALEQPDQGSTDVPVAKPPRTIRAFFGGQRSSPPAQEEIPSSSKPENTAKRRRKNTDKAAGPGQGRILLNVPGGKAWSVGRRDDDETESVGSAAPSISSTTMKGKGRAVKPKSGGGGEEEEMKDMDRKTKATRGRQNGTRGKRGRKGGTGEGGRIQQLEMKGDEDSDDPLSNPKDSSQFDSRPYQPSPKKRGRPRKPNGSTNGSRKTSRSVSTTRETSPDIHVLRSSSPNDVEITGQLNGVPKPKTLSRIKTTSYSSLKGATHQDPIDLEASQMALKPGPKKHIFASDLKPAHSFFSRNNPASGSRAGSVTSDRSGPADPKKEAATIAGSEPVDSPSDLPATAPAADAPSVPSVQNAKKSVHNFFQSSGATSKPGILKNGWGRGVKEGEEWTTPWPGSGWPVHEGGPTEPSHAGPSMRRRHYSPPPIDDQTTFWQSVMSHAVESPQSIPSTRGKGKQRAQALSGDRETYTERFRPKEASQVLGNVTESTYLRDWLSALSVGTHETNGPKVVRRVPKSRRAVDDWIVDDIGLYGPPEEEDDLDEIPEPLEDPDIPIGQRPNSYTPLSARLTNSILLTGPNGSGKSAAVYAAATELGWEVFEVYPGIGKRTGGNLMSLVGDVGKNHMVGKAKEVEDQSQPAAMPGPTAGIKSFFKPKAEGGADEGPTMGSQGEPIEVDDDHPEQPVTPPPRLRTSSVNLTPFRDETKFRQSLILIEEVDILFEEESTFWPAVVSLIAESRRPVIMTCNGIDNVAIESLPLQAILQFKPPPRDQAIEYLSSLCSTLGIAIDDQEAYVTDLYERSIATSTGLLDRPGPPNGNEWVPYFDLRKAVMQLQLERGHHSPTSHVEHDSTHDDLKNLARQLDMRSYADAYLDPRSWALMEMNELDRYEASLDDRLGTTTLLKPELHDYIPVLPAYDHTSEISSRLTKNSALSPARADLMTDQIYHIRSLLPLLDPIIPLSSHLLPHPSLFIDYMPIIQTLIQIDDIRQAAYEVAKAGGEDVRNFKTGRPMRVTAWLGVDGFSRHLELEPDALEVGRRRLRY